MLPIVDYGNIAVVISKVTAVGPVIELNGTSGFEVYLTGGDKPIFIGNFTSQEAGDTRKELVGIIAQYYYIKELGPDFEIDDIMDDMEDGDDGGDFDDKKKYRS